MSRNSYMFLDTSNDAIIEKSRSSYCKSILECLRRSNSMPMQNSGLILFMLYEVIMWGIATPDYERVNAIVDSVKRLAKQYPQSCGGWLFNQSMCSDRFSMQVNNEIQKQIFNNIA